MKTPTITISVRLKPEELNVIEEKAKEACMNRNAYIVTSMISKPAPLSPELLCRLRQIQSILVNYTGELTDDMKKNLNGGIDYICTALLK